MNEKAIDTWLDIAPAYMDFSLKFLRNPGRAFANVRGPAKVSSDHTSLLLGGVAVSYVVLLTTEVMTPLRLRREPYGYSPTGTRA